MTSSMISFPSPTGVNHYEWNTGCGKTNFKRFPSPTGVNHYELEKEFGLYGWFDFKKFPSPTGVNHYE